MVTTGARGDESGEAAGAGAGGDSDTRPPHSLSSLAPMSGGGQQNMSQQPAVKYKQSHTPQSSASAQYQHWTSVV